MTINLYVWGFTGGTVLKESACQCRSLKRFGFDPWIGKILWRRKWQPTPVSLSGESHGQGVLQATVHRVAQSWARLKRLGTHRHHQLWITDLLEHCCTVRTQSLNCCWSRWREQQPLFQISTPALSLLCDSLFARFFLIPLWPLPLRPPSWFSST